MCPHNFAELLREVAERLVGEHTSREVVDRSKTTALTQPIESVQNFHLGRTNYKFHSPLIDLLLGYYPLLADEETNKFTYFCP